MFSFLLISLSISFSILELITDFLRSSNLLWISISLTGLFISSSDIVSSELSSLWSNKLLIKYLLLFKYSSCNSTLRFITFSNSSFLIELFKFSSSKSKYSISVIFFLYSSILLNILFEMDS